MSTYSEKVLRRARQLAWDRETGHIIDWAKARVINQRKATPKQRGQYSGLTRTELHLSSTCETDWF